MTTRAEYIEMKVQQRQTKGEETDKFGRILSPSSVSLPTAFASIYMFYAEPAILRCISSFDSKRYFTSLHYSAFSVWSKQMTDNGEASKCSESYGEEYTGKE